MQSNWSFPVGLDVHWQSPQSVAFSDPYLKNWLLDTGSLTERVQSLCRQFELVVLGQGQQQMHRAEQDWLGSDQGSVDVREVLLCADGVPWVFARSVIPHALIYGELADLGSEPLGKRLFNDARFTRSAFELCTLPSTAFSDNLVRKALWGRRSRFARDGYRMIVAEVFLPPAPAYEKG
ncbi:chorismate--pyruvate lyase family protein [Alteromonas halophila]|uniref:Probable chorismate pyruvate-lyase n=1 Tax=Alteromonas halophila TaxID=516698 RepID=A0A918MYA1_9ALTE|nr:chorismate lyase [Alteromonas halophila]GGW85100.1 putative chorismate pyruvate-lyase [Alteromonas halophila]